MATTENTFTQADIEEVLKAFENRDAVAASEFWAENGVFIDPHYPESVYRGPDAVCAALEWALETIVKQPELTIRHVWETDASFAVEVDTNHIMHDGTEVDFPQVFIDESEEGQITRWQSYLPFPPPSDE